MDEFDDNNEPLPKPLRQDGKILRRLGIFFFSLVLAFVLFVAGNLAAFTGFVDFGQLLRLNNPQTRAVVTPEGEAPAEQLAARLDEVTDLIDGDSLYRYTQSDLDTATTEAIKALLETSGDRYAHYFTPEEYDEYVRSSEGEYAGIGITLSILDGEISVVDVYEDSPASDAGIEPGDVLLAIDGDRRDWELEEATGTIRRPEGESVTLVWRRGEAERETVLVTRAINIPTVVTHLIEEDGVSVGYLSLRGFNTRSAIDLQEGLALLDSAGAESFVLDLRNNPGGYLEQACDIVSLFVPTGTVVRVEDRRGIIERKVTGKTVTDKPLVVLVNGNSASASELVAVALQDHGRATIVGEQTYGKGTMQSMYKLSWGGALRYTVAHYSGPLATPVDGVGVTPDIVVEPSAEPVSPTLSDHLSTDSYRYRKGIDLQLDAALDALFGKTETG